MVSARGLRKKEIPNIGAEISGPPNAISWNWGTQRLWPSAKKAPSGGLYRVLRFTARRDGRGWLGRQDSNLGMAESKSAALPLGYAPMRDRKMPQRRDKGRPGGRTIAAAPCPINARSHFIYRAVR